LDEGVLDQRSLDKWGNLMGEKVFNTAHHFSEHWQFFARRRQGAQTRSNATDHDSMTD